MSFSLARSAAAVCAAGVVACFALAPQAAVAQAPTPLETNLQTSRFIGVGYTVNAPNQFFGVSGLVPVMGPFSLYVDTKFSHDSPGRDEHFLADVTRSQAENVFGDVFYRERDSWWNLNGAVVYAVAPQLALYGGVGYAHRSVYMEFVDLDPESERGLGGYYWIEDTDRAGPVMNALGGALLQAGRNLFFQFGVDSAPAGATAGVMFALPLR